MNTRAIIRLLDEKLGAHRGHEPELSWYCPFCLERIGRDSNGEKLGVNVKTGKANCFRCNFRAGSLESLFRSLRLEAPHGAFANAVQWGQGPLENRVLLSIYRPATVQAVLKPVPLPREYAYLGDAKALSSSLYARAYNYLEKRGVTADMVEKFRIGYCVTGDFAQRLIFPAFMGGVCVYHTNRYAGENETNSKYFMKSKNPKYVEGYHSAASCVLNFDNVVGQKLVQIVEGPFDMMAPPNAIATLGKKMTPEQIGILCKLVEAGTEEFVIFRDADAPADDTLFKLRGQLPAHTRVTAVVLTHGDPWSRRNDMDSILAGRVTKLTLTDRVRQRLIGGK